MSRLVLVPHVLGSRSLRELASSLSSVLGYKVFRVPDSRVGRRTPLKFTQGLDKLTQLTRFRDSNVPCPDFTTDRNIALSWLADDGVIVCRTLLRSSEGKGIVMAETPEQVVQAPLYTRYLKKKLEFRVHVFNGVVIDVQQKKRKSDYDGQRDTRIRNLANGYVFCRGNLNEPTDLREQALAAVASLGYTIGAVDIVYNEHHNRVVVLEVNASPGLTGTTLQRYTDAIVSWFRSL
jgi:glutathione synthase/RimK-type ligase-like ATP-grasp enzyme